MNVDKLYWPGPPFVFAHGGRKYSITNGESDQPGAVAARLLSEYATNGMTRPNPASEKGGAVPAPDIDAAEVKRAADDLHGVSHRLAGQARTASGPGGRFNKDDLRGLPTLRAAALKAQNAAADERKASAEAEATKRADARARKLAAAAPPSVTFRGGKAVDKAKAIAAAAAPVPARPQAPDQPDLLPVGDPGGTQPAQPASTPSPEPQNAPETAK